MTKQFANWKPSPIYIVRWFTDEHILTVVSSHSYVKLPKIWFDSTIKHEDRYAMCVTQKWIKIAVKIIIWVVQTSGHGEPDMMGHVYIYIYIMYSIIASHIYVWLCVIRITIDLPFFQNVNLDQSWGWWRCILPTIFNRNVIYTLLLSEICLRMDGKFVIAKFKFKSIPMGRGSQSPLPQGQIRPYPN